MIQVILVIFCIFFLQKMLQLKDNENRLKYISGKLITIPARDELPKNSKLSYEREEHNRKHSETGSLASILELKINARVVLTTNINIED